jgi:peptidoglycan hydrolase CwlO-like protein
MSDIMLLGILRMPIDYPPNEIIFMQVIQTCREAADRIEADSRKIAELEKQINDLRIDCKATHKCLNETMAYNTELEKEIAKGQKAIEAMEKMAFNRQRWARGEITGNDFIWFTDDVLANWSKP